MRDPRVGWTPAIATYVEVELYDGVSPDLGPELEQFRITFEQIPSPVAVLVGPDPVFAAASASFGRLFGGGHIVGRRLREVLPDAAASHWLTYVERVIATGEPVTVDQISLLRPGGNGAAEAEVSGIRCAPLRDGQARVIGVILEAADGRGSVDAPHDLLRTNACLRTILSAVQDGIVVHDASGSLVYANDAAARLVGQPNGEALVAASLPEALASIELLDASGAPLDHQAVPGHAALRDPPDAERVVRYRNRNTGEERWSIVRVRAVHDDAGRIVMVVNTFHDVTELQARKTAAMQSEELAESAQGRTAFLAEAGRVLAASLDAEKTLGALARLAVPRIADWCTVHVVGDDAEVRRVEIAHADPAKLEFARQLEALYPPPADERSAVVRALRTGESQLYETIPDELLDAAAQDEHHLEMLRALKLRSAMVVPLPVRDGVLGVLTLIATEDSGRCYSAADLELAEEVARRAAIAIHHAQLYEDAQAANRAKANFLALISHELRTPLTAIVGNADLIDLEVWGSINAKQRDRIDRIKSSARHLMAIIDDLLGFSRLETSREPLHIEDIDVGALVRETLDMLEVDALEKDIQLAAAIPPKPLHWTTDPNKLRQILVNLVGNAVKFTDDGSVEVEVASDDGSLVLHVRDTGPGIPPSEHERIFEPFTQVDESRTRVKGGTGLGLPVSRRLARLLGGEVTVASPGSGGTTFTVILPRAEPTS